MTEAPLSIPTEYNLNSNKNKSYSVKISFDSNLNITINTVNEIPQLSFKELFSSEYIKKNKYFSLCDNISDIILTLEPILKDEKNITLIEENNNLKLVIKLPHPKCPEIVFPFEKIKKDVDESINELYELINKLNNKVSQQEKEINELKEIIKKNDTEKKIFEEIYNPWTKDIFKYKYKNQNLFYYTLKENGYLAEKTYDNSIMHIIKSHYQLRKDKIYKLEFTVNYKGGDIEIGFGDFNHSTNYASFKDSDNCVALTNAGLYINNKNLNKNIIIENGKKYDFIIDISRKKFILNIDGLKSAEYNFDFQDNIYAQAAIRNIGNSVTIKTFEK